MSYLLFINTSNLSSEQLDHLISFKPLIREQILIFKNDRIIKYDNYFPLNLFNISFFQNCIFELNLKKFKSHICSTILDDLPDWIHGRINNNDIEYFYIDSFILYYLESKFIEDLLCFKHSLNKSNRTLTNIMLNHPKTIEFSTDDIQLNLLKKTTVINLKHQKEQICFLTLLYYFLSIDLNKEDRLRKHLKFNELKFIKKLHSISIELNPILIFKEQSSFFLSNTTQKNFIYESIDALNTKFKTDIKLFL